MEYENLHIDANSVHYLVDCDHPHLAALRNLPTFRDRFDIVSSPKDLYENISRQGLPNSQNDIGFIFLGPCTTIGVSPTSIPSGYYLV